MILYRNILHCGAEHDLLLLKIDLLANGCPKTLYLFIIRAFILLGNQLRL